METKSCEECLRLAHKNGIRTLNIYWLEDIQDGDDDWFVDVCENQIHNLCKIRWVWCVISKIMFDLDDSAEIDDSIIVVNKLFSKEEVKQAIEDWLRAKNLNFKINMP